MRAAKIYWLPILLITCWWTIAFKQSVKNNTPLNYTQNTQTESNSSQYNVSSIALIKRDQLKAGLSGDVDMMISLISEWDIEAQMLQQLDSGQYKRLDPESFLRSQIVGRHLRLAAQHLASNGHTPTNLESYLIEASAKNQQKRFLPQTYASASLLLALSEPHEIVALPEMIRGQTELHPLSLTKQIPLDVDRYNSEKIYLMAPTIAFVADYSQPTTVQALKDQGIVLHTMGSLGSIMEISREIKKIGTVIQRPQKAELLSLFIEAAMYAIDNQLHLLAHRFIEKQGEIPRVLFLNHYQHFSVPNPTSLTGQLLERIALFDITLKYASETASSDKWVVPIGKEQIVNLNPDCIIIVTENKLAIEEEMRTENTLRDVVAVKNNKIFFLDDTIQLSPTQYSVLAYQDLVEALARLL
jgi:iron complex transport system substrate-binding protein